MTIPYPKGHIMQLYSHQNIKTNGVNLHVVMAGPESGPLVILLHGFPEFWYEWRHQIDALAEQGYRVWAPDQRGYNLSDKPQGIAAYALNELAKDVIGLIEVAGEQETILVGHDWGAVVSWWTANNYPEKIKKLVIINVPHHAVFIRYARQHPSQLLKSWYMFFFQIPWLPEQIFTANNFKALTDAVQGTAQPGAYTDEDMVEYRKAWAQPGAITGMVNWYRALFQLRPDLDRSPRITVPMLLIWGKKDHVLEATMAEESIRLCDDGKLVFLENATHWVPHDEPERVNQLLIEFFS